MSGYSGWAVKLKNGKFCNDENGDVACALFSTRRSAQAWWNVRKVTELGGQVVRVNISVSEAK